MTSTRAVLRGRRLAERLMTSQCLITRDAEAAPTYDPATLTYSKPTPEVVYDGKCRVKPQHRLDQLIEAGEQPVTITKFVVSIPLDATAVVAGDFVRITSSELDPTLPGVAMRVREVPVGDQLTARRLITEVLAP